MTFPSKSRYSGRVMCLTLDTSNALFVTLQGLVSLIMLLLQKRFGYIMAGNFQSDRLDGEFGKYRQSSGGFCHISLQQIMNILSLQRLKLYSILDIASSDSPSIQKCCNANLTEEELFMLDEAFKLRSTLSETEESALYCISGDVAFKEKIISDDTESSSYVANEKYKIM